MRVWQWLWPWRWTGFVVIGAWVFVMWRLVHPGGTANNNKDLEELYPWAVQYKPSVGSSWMGIYMQGKKIGYTFHETVKDKKGDFRIEQRTRMYLQLFGFAQKIDTSSRVWVDTKYKLKRFAYGLTSPVAKLEAHGFVRGNRLQIELFTGGTRRRMSIQYRHSLLPSALRAYITSKKLPVGHKLKTMIFDPLTRAYTRMVITVEGRETLKIRGKTYKALRLAQHYRGMKLMVWLDDKGRTLKEQAPTGMVLLRETGVEASRGLQTGFDMVRATQVQLKGRIPRAKQRTSLRLRLDNINLTSFPELNRGRQLLSGRVLLVRREQPKLLPRVAYPGQPKSWSKAAQIALVSTPLVQSDHPKIKAAATKIVEGQKTRFDAVLALKQWVFRKVRKQSVVGIPSALETLNKKVGDCNEHATLLAALGRAVKIPCRIVSGLAYLRGKFFYHAWNECHVGRSQWLTVDATWGQVPADVTHVAFVRGGLDKQVALVQLLGKIKIEVLDAKTATTPRTRAIPSKTNAERVRPVPTPSSRPTTKPQSRPTATRPATTRSKTEPRLTP